MLTSPNCNTQLEKSKISVSLYNKVKVNVFPIPPQGRREICSQTIHTNSQIIVKTHMLCSMGVF